MSAAVFSFPAVRLPAARQGLAGGRPSPTILAGRYFADTTNTMLRLWTDPPDHLAGIPWPLVLYGPAGSGKTVLAEDLVRRLDGPWYVTTGADFRQAFHNSGLTRSQNRLLDQVTGHAGLLVDQWMVPQGESGLDRAWVQIMEALVARDCPVVITMLTAPFADKTLSSELRSRLSGGLTIPVRHPGPAARQEIAGRMLGKLNLNIHPDDLAWLARQLPESVPGISQVLARLAIETGSRKNSGDTGETRFLDRACLRQSLEYLQPPANRDSLAVILQAVSRLYGLPVAEVVATGRKRLAVRARGVTAWLARSLLGVPYADIGRLLGRRDASTIRHACQTIDSQRQTDPALKRQLNGLQEYLECRMPRGPDPIRYGLGKGC